MAWHVLVLHPFYGCVETMHFLHVVIAGGHLDCSQLSATVTGGADEHWCLSFHVSTYQGAHLPSHDDFCLNCSHHF